MAVKMKLGKSEKIKLVQRGRAAPELGYVRNLVIIVDRYKVCLKSRCRVNVESLKSRMMVTQLQIDIK